MSHLRKRHGGPKKQALYHARLKHSVYMNATGEPLKPGTDPKAGFWAVDANFLRGICGSFLFFGGRRGGGGGFFFFRGGMLLAPFLPL